MTTAEHEERARLETVKTALRHALWQLDARLDHYDAEIKQQKAHMWDARRDMDPSRRLLRGNPSSSPAVPPTWP